MSLINPDENLIRITPPIPFDRVANGPSNGCATIRTANLQGVGIEVSAKNWLPQDIRQSLQAIVDFYPEHAFTGHVEIRNAIPNLPPITRYVMRGRKVVRVDPHIGWPTEPDADGVDPEHEALLQILYSAGDGGTFVEMCAGDFDRSTMVNADQTDLPEALLAWRDAAVQAATADSRWLLEAAERREDELVVHIDKLEAGS